MPGRSFAATQSATSVFIGSSPVNWRTMLTTSGGVSIHWTGRISPRAVRYSSSAHLRLRGLASRCGLVRQTIVMSATSTSRFETLPCMSSVPAIGTSGPTMARTCLGERGVHVGVLLGHRRAVVGDEHAVPRPLVAEHPEHLGGQPVVGVLRDRRERPGLRPHQRHGLEAELARRLEVARDRVERARRTARRSPRPRRMSEASNWA